jgi:hypothetical protein
MIPISMSHSWGNAGDRIPRLSARVDQRIEHVKVAAACSIYLDHRWTRREQLSSDFPGSEIRYNPRR